MPPQVFVRLRFPTVGARHAVPERATCTHAPTTHHALHHVFPSPLNSSISINAPIPPSSFAGHGPPAAGLRHAVPLLKIALHRLLTPFSSVGFSLRPKLLPGKCCDTRNSRPRWFDVASERRKERCRDTRQASAIQARHDVGAG